MLVSNNYKKITERNVTGSHYPKGIYGPLRPMNHLCYSIHIFFVLIGYSHISYSYCSLIGQVHTQVQTNQLTAYVIEISTAFLSILDVKRTQFHHILDKQSIKEQAPEAKVQSMDQVETTLVQTPKLTKVENMNGEQVSYKVTLLTNQDDKSGETKSEVRRFVVPQDCSTSMVYLKEKLRLVLL